MLLLQVKNEKKHLEKKVLDLEEILKDKQQNNIEQCVPTLDVACECMLITNFKNNNRSGRNSDNLETDRVPEVRSTIHWILGYVFGSLGYTCQCGI